MIITISAPHGFDYRRTVLSHGWRELAPCEFDPAVWSLRCVLEIGRAEPVSVLVTWKGDALSLFVSGRALGKPAVAEIVRQVRHIFRLDDDLSEFYETMAGHPDFDWIGKQGAGRMLRSPTVFEDLVKTICTTNCSWSLTEKMVSGLVNHLGQAAPDGRRAFPTADVMAAQPEKFYRDVIKAGYRAPYFRELAERIASGELEIESWLTSDLPTPELKKEMKRVKGVGDYAAENLLKLVGRYDVLALDSWIRPKFMRTRNNGRKCSDRKIERYYAKFGAWRGLALWCDLTRDWIED
jgi:3-methyladenine DNA glycosylase/8-oxoguanine DNA glycosylase